MLKPCLICYRLTNGSGDSHSSNIITKHGDESSSGSRPEALSQFFKMLERYLDDNSSGRKGGAEAAKQLHFEGAIHSFIACMDCSNLVESFCDLHHQMKSLELLLNWKLWTLKNIMLGGQRVPSRMKDLRKYANQLEIEDVCADDIIEFKRDLVAKCRQKLSATYPKLTIKKYCPADKTIKPGQPPKSNETKYGAANLIPIHESDKDEENDEVNFGDFHEDTVPLVGSNNDSIPIPNAPELVEGSGERASRLRQHYRCPTCSKTFSTQERMDRHNQTHIMQQSAELPEDANENPEPQEELLGEEEVHKETNETFRPPVTQKPTMCKRKFKKYEWSFNSQTGNYKCRHCTKEFSRKTSVCLHFQSAHLNLKYKCPRCSHVCTQKGNLKTHLRNVHNEWWSKVENKEEALSSAQTLSNLMSLTNSKLKAQCRNWTARKNRRVKRKASASPPDVISPEELVHLQSNIIDNDDQPTTTAQLPAQCQKAKARKIRGAKKLSSAKELEIQPGKPWSSVDPLTGKHTCSVCSKELANPSSLKIHYESLHLKLRHKCQRCGKEYALKDYLRKHMQTVHFGRLFKCSFCPLSFSTRTQKQRHLRSGCQKRTNWNGMDRADDIDFKPLAQSLQHYTIVTNLVQAKYETTSQSEEIEEDININIVPNFPDLLLQNHSEGRASLDTETSQSETFILPDDDVPVIQPLS